MRFLTFVVLTFLGSASLACASPVRLVAFGDAPYRKEDQPKFAALIRQINQVAPDFSVHVGDFKGGSVPCTDELFLGMRDQFQLFEQPLIYTPGDNEWTDCHRPKAGGYDSIERLATLRRIFFTSDLSFGAQPLTLSRQSANPGFEKFVENARWSKEGVIFATLHVVGSNNGLNSPVAAAPQEFSERNAANLAWLRETFDSAMAQKSDAVVLFMQADLFYPGATEEESRGFQDLLTELRVQSIRFQKPVLLVHGDTHQFIWDYPLATEDQKHLIDNFMRLEVYGDPFVQGVLIEVDPESRQPFTVRPLPPPVVDALPGM